MFSFHLCMKQTTITNKAPAITTEISNSARFPARDVADLSCSAVADDDEAPLIAADNAPLPVPPTTFVFLLLAASSTCASLSLLFFASTSCLLSTPSSVVLGGFCLLVTEGGGELIVGEVILAPRREVSVTAGLVVLGPSGCTRFLFLASAKHTLANHTHSAMDKQALLLPHAILTWKCLAEGKKALAAGETGDSLGRN